MNGRVSRVLAVGGAFSVSFLLGYAALAGGGGAVTVGLALVGFTVLLWSLVAYFVRQGNAARRRGPGGGESD